MGPFIIFRYFVELYYQPIKDEALNLLLSKENLEITSTGYVFHWGFC